MATYIVEREVVETLTYVGEDVPDDVVSDGPAAIADWLADSCDPDHVDVSTLDDNVLTVTIR